MWCLIVSIPDLCFLSYLYWFDRKATSFLQNLDGTNVLRFCLDNKLVFKWLDLTSAFHAQLSMKFQHLIKCKCWKKTLLAFELSDDAFILRINVKMPFKYYEHYTIHAN